MMDIVGNGRAKLDETEKKSLVMAEAARRRKQRMKTLPQLYDELAAENERLRAERGALKDHADYLEHGVREWREETMRLRELYMHISGCVVCRDRGWKQCGIAGMLRGEE